MFAVTNFRLSRWNVAIGIYAVVAIVAVAGVLLTPGTLGHHWDWLIPSDPSELRRFAAIEGASWQDYDFGSYVTYRYATILTSLLFGMPGYVGLTGAFVTKALVVLSIFVSGAGMRFLLLSLSGGERDDRDGIVATFGGLLYALTPYAFNQIVAGDQSALIADALSPIAIGLAVRAVSARDRLWAAYALGSSLLLAIIVASVQVFVFTLAVMWVVCLALQWSRRTALRLAGLAAAAIALCAFWILPALVAGGAVHTVVQTSPIETAFATFGQFSNPFLTFTMLAFPGDFYLHALGPGAALFFIAYAALAALCVVALFKRRSPLLVVLSVVFAVMVVLPLGGNPIVGPLILAIFKALLPYSLFLRTPQHMMFVVALVMPMLVYLSARVIPPRFFARSLVAAAAIVLAYGQGFFVHSNFFGLIGPFRESAGERATVASAQAPENDGYRTLFVPNAPGYYFHPAIFDYYFEGSDEPQIRFLPGMTMGAGVKWTPYEPTQELLKALDEFVPDGADAATQRMLLQMAGVKQIVVHAIGVPTAGVRLTVDRDRSYLERALGSTGLATPQASYDDRSVWRFDRPSTRIYAPDCLFGVSPRAEPYDVLALAPAAAACAHPATVATAVPAQRSEYLLSSTAFRTKPQTGIAVAVPQSNVEIDSYNRGHGFFAIVPSGVQDVEMFPAPPKPARATGLSFRMYSNAPRRVYVQLYCPDYRNFYQTNVDFSGKVLDVALNFRDFGSVGHPDLRKLRYVRFASDNTHLRDLTMYFGDFAWLYTIRHTSVPSYLTVAGNRWDTYYFGGDRDHVMFAPTARRTPAYATVRIQRAGTYDVVAHVQDVRRALSLQASIDGRTSRCSISSGTADETERLVRLVRLPLAVGNHTVELRFCGSVPPPDPNAVAGVQSVIVALARPTASNRLPAAGSVQVSNEHPGTIRVTPVGTFLVFTDSYDDRWVATQSGSVLQHVVANGYANGWIVPNPAAGDVVLRFWPQRSFELGIALSLALAFVTLAAIFALVVSAQKPSERRHPIGLERSGQIEHSSQG